MIKPDELESPHGRTVWDTLIAAAQGDVPGLRRLIDADPYLARAEYWYAPAIHFAVRGGHQDAVGLLLDAGADPEWNGLHDVSLIDMAQERGHAAVSRLLACARDERGRTIARPTDHPVHRAAETGDVAAVRALLDADPDLVSIGSRFGATPLHRAVVGGSRDTVNLLLDRGANVNARRGGARGLSGGFWCDVEPIDVALWHNGRGRSDDQVARLLRPGRQLRRRGRVCARRFPCRHRDVGGRPRTHR